MKKPNLGKKLNAEQIDFLNIFCLNGRRIVLEMLKNSQSGHPGGALSSIDFLSVIYAYIIAFGGEKIVISNGHVSAAVYAILAQLGYVDEQKLITSFRKFNSIFEGHVARLVPGIWYGTGPLGVGLSAAVGMAWAEKKSGRKKKVFAVMGDGEAQEGEVYEMMNFAGEKKLDNFIVFCDANGVQLTDAVKKIMADNIGEHFRAAGWEVMKIDGHNYQEIWGAIGEAEKVKDKPVVIFAKTVMGKGVDFMESEGLKKRATWHGKVPSAEQLETVLPKFQLTEKQKDFLESFIKQITWFPEKPKLHLPIKNKLSEGKPILYSSEKVTDCRSAYGNALLDLASHNPEIVALTADLRGSVKTEKFANMYEDRFIECGIAEQHMLSMAGGISLSGYVPFVSTYAAFMTSRAKDQARVNDINLTNVKMVATHAGLSNGPDGPTHQAIDDSGSFLGLFNTKLIEPVDPNQTDRMIRYITVHNGNFYVRMGRQTLPIITDNKGEPFYNLKYKYFYGRCDLIREGDKLTVVAMGPMVHEALEAWEELNKLGEQNFELIAVTSIKQFSKVLDDSIKKTGNVLTLEDHNLYSGLNSQVARHLLEEKIVVNDFAGLGVSHYFSSGKVDKLYGSACINARNIVKYIREFNKNKKICSEDYLEGNLNI